MKYINKLIRQGWDVDCIGHISSNGYYKAEMVRVSEHASFGVLSGFGKTPETAIKRLDKKAEKFLKNRLTPERSLIK
jgi:hypothetical protein